MMVLDFIKKEYVCEAVKIVKEKLVLAPFARMDEGSESGQCDNFRHFGPKWYREMESHREKFYNHLE
jgi:hypothetical protein